MRPPALSLVPLALCLLLVEAIAGDLETLQVDREGKRYTIYLVLHMRASVEELHGVLLDVDEWERLHDTLVEARLLPGREGAMRARIVMRPCVLFYCKELVQVLDFEATEPPVLVARVDPELSSFSHGHMSWAFQDEGEGRTRVEFDAILEPSFWVPPVIGHWIVRNKLESFALEINQAVEAQLRTGSDVGV